VDYSEFEFLRFERRAHGVLVITIDRPPLNAVVPRLHVELGQVWKAVAEDEEVRVALLHGAGKHFSVGGDLEMMEAMTRDPVYTARSLKEASDLVYNMMNCSKPIIAAIKGVTIGAGAAAALMADITIMGETAQISDGHVLAGVTAGDHAAIIWPLLIGMAKAKYYLLTAERISGREAERMGLVSLCVPDDRLMEKAHELADKIAQGSQVGIRGTKRSLNNWLRLAGPTFDASLAIEMIDFLGPDASEAMKALREKRSPRFPSAQ
jgi:enoyl-CoA hydratase